MLVIGSRALARHDILPEGRVCNDWDFICTFEEFQKWTKANKEIIRHCVPLSGSKFHVRDCWGMNYEFEIAWPDTSAQELHEQYVGFEPHLYFAPAEVLLALKLSHRYLKDSPHFLKTMRDIQHLRTITGLNPWLTNWLVKREAETYVYKHPKLDVSKGDFFTGDGVQYVYDHDTIHLTVAINVINYADGSVEHVPAYTRYMKEGSDVMTSKEKFFSVGENIRLYGVYEESCVLALERSQIPHGFIDKEPAQWINATPHPRWSFEMALMKVCTSITSGWFRCWAWEHYDKVLALYESLGEDDYVKRFEKNKHLLKPYVKE